MPGVVTAPREIEEREAKSSIPDQEIRLGRRSGMASKAVIRTSGVVTAPRKVRGRGAKSSTYA